VQVLGQKKRINAGLSSVNVGANQGFVFGCPMVTTLPPAYRRKAAKLVANKVALLARYDAYGTSSSRSGQEGQRMREAMNKTIEKWMEPPPAAIIKPLAKPDAVSKKKRGGARYRKQKEKMSTTEMMKQANRMQFGKAEEEYVDGDEMFGLGMLGKDGHGKLKVMQAASKITKREKLLQRAANGVTGGKGHGPMSGTQTSLTFSHVQGIELENPNKMEESGADVGGQRSGTESYFSELSGFKTFRKLN
jgi:U4/U6 small nuclear ribonucleoprotein PRP31